MKLAISLLLTLAITGCATSRPVMGPNGKLAQVIDGCRTAAQCYEKAAEVCPRGYAFINTHETSGVVMTKVGFTYVAVPTNETTLFVECNV